MKTDANENQRTLLSTKELLARLPVCQRTLANWKAKGVIPYIQIGQYCLYDWDRVQAVLRANERGGNQ
ncbi:MAG TPA: hypothetical protein VGY98_14035 [Verrucomicrobiae bacterium]|jgi:hypothetical protein|nr:hypothetical protein [Verrucomicrobiae bacterium]